VSAVRLFVGETPLIHQLRRTQRRQGKLRRQAASGLRVLSAADDPANLARAQTMATRTRSRRMAMRNVEDGISVLQTAEGGLAQTSELLARLRELATQAASGVLVGPARVAIQTEAASVLAEVDRVAKSTGFQGAELLSQEHVDIAFVLDTSASMNAELNQVVASISSMFNSFQAAGLDARFGLATARSTLDPVDNVVRNVDIGGGGFLGALAAAAGSTAGGAMDPYSALLNTSGADDFNGDGDAFTWREDAVRHIIYVTDTGQETAVAPGNPTQSATGAAIGAEGVSVHVIARAANFGVYSQVTSLTGGTLQDIGNASGSGVPAAMDSITNSMIGGAPESASEPLVVQVGIDDTDDDRIDIGVSLDATRVGLGLTGLDFSSPTGAGAALDAVDAAIDTVNGHRATIGANQNRLASVLRNHENMLENEVEAQSVVEDFDYAEGIAELTRANVLADAGHALLARSLRQQRSLAAAMTSRLIGAPK
jgi:flagellin